MKKLLVFVTALVAVVLVAVVLLVGNVERIVKGLLEGVGSELLGTPVRVRSVELDLREGAGSISGFSIANPPGYSPGKAFHVDTIRLDLKLSSLKGQPLVIEELTVRDPVVRVEVKEDGSANLKTLLDNIERNGDRADRKAAEEKPAPAGAPEGEPVRISFGELAFTGTTVHASVPGREPEEVVLPDIVMRDVGKEKGLTPAGIGKVVLGKIIGESLEAVLKKKMTEKVEEAARGFLEDVKEKFAPGKDR